ncbi:acylneuraminate cytidylyltransferase family protein [Rhizobium sp. CNPSo 3490]|uniref:acylneuraminate cytidylyltransferase family protein n=1 Tax=Rhizobium sp. CNPSo 3490 TaxID=3021407 RepID=UPI00254C3D1E|nr:acylneuraminate cytidylyltransferase family protein [Rhizobium sp. CNPSo 3490]MDK4736476.1 acylneuraminate cytidylyltransferase family protein [Rhizobium sp. CNPSo 3490]
MSLLFLIPARGGSKRVPGKNIRELGGQPLISWTIDLAKRVGLSADVLVSTDDPDIASIATEAGAWVPWLRPHHLSTDTATSLEVALHALDFYESERGPVEAVVLLQPTSPFRQLSTVCEGLRLFRELGERPVIGVSPAATHPAWCFKIQESELRPYTDGKGLLQRSQDLPQVYEISGALYIISAMQLRDERTFFPHNAVPIVSDSDVENLDIDTEWDWLCAEKAVEAGLAKFGAS